MKLPEWFVDMFPHVGHHLLVLLILLIVVVGVSVWLGLETLELIRMIRRNRRINKARKEWKL